MGSGPSNLGEPLYDRDAAASLRRREASWLKDNDEKFDLLLDAIRRRGPCRRLVDIGCGWGQFLAKAAAALPGVEELWGVDESPERARDVAAACPQARVVICRADRLELPDAHFDVAVTSQMLHEVQLFGAPGELAATLREIRRVLGEGGLWLLLDHQDAGEGEVVVDLPAPARELLSQFERKFQFYKAMHHEVADGSIRISRRCLQDFLTKHWSLGTAMEPIEMNETHNVFRQEDTVRLVRETGFKLLSWQDFADIRADLSRVGGRLLNGAPWARKFLLAAEKV